MPTDDCQAARDRLLDQTIAGFGEGSPAGAMKEHLRRCPGCAKYLEGLRAASGAIRPLLEPFKPSPLGVLVSTAYGYQRPALMLFYACAIVLLSLHERWGRILAPLRFTGRMPLTNYLMQSVICTLIFYGYGLGFYERVGPTLCLVLAFVIFPVQVLTSIWWFRHFRFGPAEWLWRMLTYGAAPKMLLEPSESPVAV